MEMDKDGMTALMWASLDGQPEVASMLSSWMQALALRAEIPAPRAPTSPRARI